jgi:hypothetical protein
LRAGEMALPTFLVSDSRNVGYANTWLRPPAEVYSFASFDTFRGADITYQHSVGPYTVTLGALAGRVETDDLYLSGFALIVHGRNLRGYNAALDVGPLTLRYSHVKADVDVLIGNYIAGKLFYTFSSIGAMFDRNNVVAQAEFIARHAGQTDVDYNAWYTLGGYRLGLQ